MTTTESRQVLRVPARDVPIPTSISPEAQAALAAGPILTDRDWPPGDDADGWRAALAEVDQQVLDMIEGAAGISASADEIFGVRVEDRDVDGVTVYVVTDAGLAADDPRVYLDVHGGGFVQGGGLVCRLTAAVLASLRASCCERATRAFRCRRRSYSTRPVSISRWPATRGTPTSGST